MRTHKAPRPLTEVEVKAFALRYFGTRDKFDDLVLTAIAERGGHCRNCGHCKSIYGEKPVPMPHMLRQENISVRVICGIDIHRQYPFREVDSQKEQCPSLRRHQRRNEQIQAKIAE